MDTTTEQLQLRRGEFFVRGSWRQMFLLSVLLALVVACVHLYGGVIRYHRSLAASVERLERQAEQARAQLADGAALEAEVASLHAGRAGLLGWTVGSDARTLLEPRLRTACERADLRFEGLAAQPVRARGAIDATPCKLRFSGRRHEVPVLVDGVYRQDELVAITALDLEVVNFIDDRVTGSLVVEVFRLRDPPPPSGALLRPYLTTLPPAPPGGPLSALGGERRRAVEEAHAQMAALYFELLDHEALRAARDHYRAEAEELQRLAAGRADIQAEVARTLPRVDRALTRSALGRAGFVAEPGGAPEIVTWD